ncbi:hypothetical protein LEP1GSC058_1967 [Leptospira fainei serovar Hurstbridge str. BUT 6]|uniref:Uncharacterized protein n=1 Tax=Leptospira fainei serovar Hurstbridge str. BUT 6 TaxID=1193011 RepID=S3W4P8_9LEPT|nr:hypothetical protein LEP1GSC058_1967 [Leptospira fainei serovar Hurstbridge str. BUT 6]
MSFFAELGSAQTEIGFILLWGCGSELSPRHRKDSRAPGLVSQTAGGSPGLDESYFENDIILNLYNAF